MIRVTIEMLPKGSEERKYRLGTLIIYNNGGTATQGVYEAVAYSKRGAVWKQARVEGFPRKKLLAFDLLYRVLREMCGERNK